MSGAVRSLADLDAFRPGPEGRPHSATRPQSAGVAADIRFVRTLAIVHRVARRDRATAAERFAQRADVLSRVTALSRPQGRMRAGRAPAPARRSRLRTGAAAGRQCQGVTA